MPSVFQVVMALAFAFPCLAMAVRLLHVWRRPMEVEEGRWISLGMGVLLMEFVLHHAGVMLAAAAIGADGVVGRLGAILGLVVFYGLFAGGLSFAFKSRMLLESFLWMIGGRFVALVVGISTQEVELLLAHSAVALGLFMAVVILTLALPVPRLGITPEIARAKRMPNSSGAWVDEPQRAIGAGVIYFFTLGMVELFVMSWINIGG